MKYLVILIVLISMFASAKSILVIESYSDEYLWDKSYKRAIQDVLGSDYKYHFFEMNTKKISKDLHESQAQKAWLTYQEIKPDLVFLGDDAANEFLARRFSKEKTPVVFLGVNKNPRAYYDYHAPNITGVLERPLYNQNLLLIKEIVPDLKRLLILLDTDRTSEIIFQDVFHGKFHSQFGKVVINIEFIPSFATWKTKIKNAKSQGYQAVVAGTFHTLIDEKGVVLPTEEVAIWTGINCDVPVFSFWDFTIGQNKAVGGIALEGYAHGKEAAEIAYDILKKGKKPSDVGVQTGTKGKLIFSREQLKKYNLTLPPDLQNTANFVD